MGELLLLASTSAFGALGTQIFGGQVSAKRPNKGPQLNAACKRLHVGSAEMLSKARVREGARESLATLHLLVCEFKLGQY